MLFKENDIILFFGDSITDSGRRRPYGEAAINYRPYGDGYVNDFFKLLFFHNHRHYLKIINQGFSGNTVKDLIIRFDEDVRPYKPNYVIVMIGVNDIRGEVCSPNDRGYLASKEKYKKELETLIIKIQDIDAKVILCSPFYIEINKKDIIRMKVDEYVNVCNELSNKYNLVFVDTQKEFDEYLKKVQTYELSEDRIHPNPIGHQIIANAIFNKIKINI